MQKLLVVAVLLLCSLCLCHCSLFGGKARALSLKPALIAEAVVDKKEKDNNMQLNALELCLCGAMATIFGDFVMHPVDTIKIMQQSAGQCFPWKQLSV